MTLQNFENLNDIIQMGHGNFKLPKIALHRPANVPAALRQRPDDPNLAANNDPYLQQLSKRRKIVSRKNVLLVFKVSHIATTCFAACGNSRKRKHLTVNVLLRGVWAAPEIQSGVSFRAGGAARGPQRQPQQTVWLQLLCLLGVHLSGPHHPVGMTLVNC